MKKIAVVGSFVMDQIAKVDKFPSPGETIIGTTIKNFPGGKGANQAVASARLGACVKMFGKVGNDANGKTFLDLFEQEGIDVSSVTRDEQTPTGMGLIQINRDAENKIVVIPGANHTYSLDNLQSDMEAITASDLVVTQLELQNKITFELIKKCSEKKVPIILNPAPAVHIPDEILRHVTYLTPNETELEILSGMKVDSEEKLKEAIKKLLKLGVKNVIATLGKNGAVIGNADGFDFIKGYSVRPLDTVAAGDSFNGALATCIVSGMDLKASVKYANAVGGITVTREGAIPSLPLKEEVEFFLQS